MARKKETTEVTVSLDTGRQSLSMSLEGSPSAELTMGLDKPMAEVKDVRINGESVVSGKVASVTLGAGLTFNGGLVGLSLGALTEAKPKEMTLGAQKNVKLMAEVDGTMQYVSAGKLDYSRMRVGRETDLNTIDEKDFLFEVKEDNNNGQ